MQTRHNRQTLIYFVLIFVVLFGGLELAARSAYLRQRVIPIGIGDNHFFQIKMDRLYAFAQSHEHIECVFIGNSTVHRGLDPEWFSTGYDEAAGETINCFSLSTPGMDIEVAEGLIRYIIDTYHPSLIVYGIAAQNFSDGLNSFREDQINSDWWAYVQGGPDLTGWALEHSYAFRLAYTYQFWSSPEYQDRIAQLNRFDAQTQANGFAPLQNIGFDVRLPTQPRDEKSAAKYQSAEFPSHRPLAAYARTAVMGDWPETDFVIVMMPNHPDYCELTLGFPCRNSDLMEDLAQVAAEANTPFWPVFDIANIPDAFWLDRTHLSSAGAALFSYWLGQHIGQAQLQQDWTPPDKMELKDISFFAPGPLGFADQADYERYLRYIKNNPIVPDGSTVFSPMDDEDVYNRTYGITQYLNLGQATTLNRWNYQFQVLYLFTHVQFLADLAPAQQDHIKVWLQTWLPDDLKAAGVDYVLIQEDWLADQSQTAQDRLNDPALYEIVLSVDPHALPNTYLLLLPK